MIVEVRLHNSNLIDTFCARITNLIGVSVISKDYAKSSVKLFIPDNLLPYVSRQIEVAKVVKMPP